MDDKQLKKLSRADLIELLLEQTKRNEELEEKLKDRSIKLEKAGNIAEASLGLNEVFEKAQAAADLYVENIQNLYEEAKDMVVKAKLKYGVEEEENNGKDSE